MAVVILPPVCQEERKKWNDITINSTDGGLELVR